MAAVTTIQDYPVGTNFHIYKVKIVCDATYAAGGYDISASIDNANVKGPNELFGLAQVRHAAANGLIAVWRPTVKKVSLFESTTGAPAALVEVANNSVHVSASTIIDLVLFAVDSVGTTS